MNKSAEKKLIIACVALLVATLLTAGYFFQQALNAKYATSGEGNSEGTIAKFDVKINDEGEGLGWDNGGKFDPFTSANLKYTCQVTNGSEVKVKATPKIDQGLLGDSLEVDSEGIVTATLEPGQTGVCKIPVKLKSGFSSVEPTTVQSVKVNVEAVQQAE